MGARSPRLIPDSTAQGSSARKISSHNFWLQQTSRDLISGRNHLSPKQFVLKNPDMNLLRLTTYELQHWGSSLKGTNDIQGKSEVHGIKARTGGQPSPT